MITIIIEAKDIPIGAKVRKVDHPFFDYILINDIEVIANGTKYENRAHQDCLFIMFPHNIGSLEAIKPDMKLEWRIEKEENFDYLKGLFFPKK